MLSWFVKICLHNFAYWSRGNQQVQQCVHVLPECKGWVQQVGSMCDKVSVLNARTKMCSVLACMYTREADVCLHGGIWVNHTN